ncbi:MAG: CARDB domain-containing protein [Candidatus Methanofastidiosia archaeon]|jgi:hypothetical protein
MKKVLAVVTVLVLGLCSLQTGYTQENAVLTVVVKDVYGDVIDNARVRVDYLFEQPEDVEIPDEFTENGRTAFVLEVDREYVVTITKAGFLPFSDIIDFEKETTLAATLEYAQQVPVLHVNRYTVTPHEINPGKTFQVSLAIENQGTGDALAVKVVFVPTQIFSPVQPSSSAYFERLDSGELVTLTQTFAVSGDAPSGVYDIQVTISYTNATGQPYTMTETIGVPVLRIPLITLLNIDYPETAEQGETFTFSAEIGNIGRFPVNGVYIEVESDMEWEYSSYYIGTLEAGDFDTFISEVTSTIPGVHTFTVTTGYIDDFNQEHQTEQSFTVTITEKEKEPPPPERKGLWQRFIELLKAFLGLK